MSSRIARAPDAPRSRIWFFRLQMYVLFSVAGACLLLGLLLLLGGAGVWMVLKVSGGVQLGIRLLIGALVSALLGFVALFLEGRARSMAPPDQPGRQAIAEGRTEKEIGRREAAHLPHRS